MTKLKLNKLEFQRLQRLGILSSKKKNQANDWELFEVEVKENKFSYYFYSGDLDQLREMNDYELFAFGVEQPVSLDLKGLLNHYGGYTQELRHYLEEQVDELASVVLSIGRSKVNVSNFIQRTQWH